MKTHDSKTSTSHSSAPQKPFFSASPEHAFFSAERAQPTPFFQPQAVSPPTIQAKSGDESEEEVQRMPAFDSEVTTNGEVQRKLINSPRHSSALPIQAKLTIGEPGDKYEQEADRVASQVVEQINAPAPAQSTQGQTVQRQGGEEEEMQAKPEITAIQRMEEPRNPNQTGLPDHLKAGVENLSGYSLDDVRVHYNSPKPAPLQALAYTQGTEIHVAPGQEKHLPHEAWHVVQQMQGRVKPTMQMKGVQINDNEGLEREADVMGNQLLHRQMSVSTPSSINFCGSHPLLPIVQRQIGENGDQQLVINNETRQIYLAKRNTIGSYDLYSQGPSGDYYYSLQVETGDPNYHLYEGGGFFIRADQSARRVYTQMPSTMGLDEFTELHKQAGGGGREGDFSYSDMSRAFHSSLKKVEPEEADEAIKTGANLPLTEGEIDVNMDQDLDLQLIPFHLLQYQKFHTPPNLKSASREDENPWRQEELEFTRDAMQLPDASGLKKILPELEGSEDKHSQLRHIYPGPIDISFPPDEEKTLFDYSRNKAIFLLNKKVRLAAYKEREAGKKHRKAITDSYLEMLKNQDDSTVTDAGEYLKKTLGLKITETDSGDESLDEDSEWDSSDEEADKLIDDSEDDLETASKKHTTYQNALGTQIKLLNTKILEDEIAINQAKEGRKRLIKLRNLQSLRRAEASRMKHEQILSRLEKRHSRQVPILGPKFKAVHKQKQDYLKKRELLDKLPKEFAQKPLYKRYDEEVTVYGQKTPIKRLRERSEGLLPGIGEKTLKQILEGEKSASKPKRTRKDKDYKSPVPEWADSHNGNAMYGNNNGNNCLIYAIAYAVGYDIPADQVDSIRKSLIAAEIADAQGFLPAYGRSVEIIAQHIYAKLREKDMTIPSIRIQIDTVLPGIAPVIVGEGDNTVYIFHDGTHFWWLKPN